jgi:hypothetical protein
MSYSSNAQKINPVPYVNPWYLALAELGKATTSELKSMPKQRSDETGVKPTSKPCTHCGAPGRVMRDSKTNSGWTTNQVCNQCSWLWSQYRIRTPEYNAMLEADNKCAICHKEPGGTHHKKLAVDHCHETGKIRGLLCMPCNTAIGKLPTVELLTAAVEYLSLKLLIDADYVVYKCCASAESEIDFGNDVIVVTSKFSDALACVRRDLKKITQNFFDPEVLLILFR